MTWELFNGTGEIRRPEARGGETQAPPAWRKIPDLPPWRRRAKGGDLPVFVPSPGLADAVNTALHLRRPLLLMGSAGMGKSTVIDLVARELELGKVLRWHITSKSTLNDGLYEYDALDRLHATQVDTTDERVDTSIGAFVRLGPLGTALASPEHPRALLIDEIDKSDVDLPGDLLNVLEAGEFEIPPLQRSKNGPFQVRGADRRMYDVGYGTVERRHYPVIILTSNNERTFAPPFLRRCIRFKIDPPDAKLLTEIVSAHLHDRAGVAQAEREAIEKFAARLKREKLAVNQLLELVHLVTGLELTDAERDRLRSALDGTLLKNLAEP